MKKIMLTGSLAICLLASTQESIAQSWNLTGNAGINTSTNFLGTTDNKALKIKTNNQTRMTISGAGKIGIGNASPVSRLDILGSSTATDAVVNIVGKYTGASDVIGLNSTSIPTDTNGIGVVGNGNLVGVNGFGNNIGVEGDGFIGVLGASGTTATTGEPTGIWGQNSGGSIGNGVFGYSTNATQNIAVWGIAPDTSTATSPVDFAGYFQGNVLAWRYYTPSDRRLKTNIQPLGNVMSKLSKLETANYNFKTSEYPNLYLPSDLQTGFMASNLQEQFPNLVQDVQLPAKYDRKTGAMISQSASIKVVNYMGMIPVLTAAIQEQQAQLTVKNDEISQLKNTLLALENRLNQLENKMNNNSSSEKVLIQQEGAELLQNVPNPFNQSSRIDYTLPEGFQSARVILTNELGSTVAIYNLKGKGKGQINVQAGEFAAGNYKYSLIIDGVTKETKSMIIAK